jgi:hypothetical protein
MTTTTTSFTNYDMERIERVALADQSSTARIVRKAALAGLLELEREVLGEQFVGGFKTEAAEVVA